MKLPKRNLPPALADRLLHWLCKDEWLEPIKGDLYEQFLEDQEQSGSRKARRRYWINAFHFLRPFAMKNLQSPTDQWPALGMITRPLFRHMKKKPGFYTINILGLALGLTVVFLSTLWISYHTSFDGFHKTNRIYQMMTRPGEASVSEKHSGGAVYSVMEEAKTQIADIEYMTRIVASWRWPAEQCFKVDPNQSCIYSMGIFADSSFFKVFDFKIASGDPNPLRGPRQIALSASLAEKLYGEENPIGQTYQMDNHYAVEVVAVFEDLPANSTLQFEFIAPLTVATDLQGVSLDTWRNFSYATYLTLHSDDPEPVAAQINNLEEAVTAYDDPNLYLYPFDEVHLAEYGPGNGGLIVYIRIIRIFSFFILIISIVNFINLTTAHATSRGKEIGVRKIIGAGKGTLKLHFLIEISFSVLIAAAMALLASYFLLPSLASLIGEPVPFQLNPEIGLHLGLAILITILLAGLYPAFVLSAFKPLVILKNQQFKASGNHTSRQVLTIAQVSISTFIILMSLVFYHQLQYMQRHDLGYDKEGIMILEPTWRHIQHFEAFKNDLLQHPEIKNLGISNAKLIEVYFELDNVDWPGRNQEGKQTFKAIGIDNGLLKLMGLPALEGTHFTSDTIPQMILTRSAAKAIGLEEVIGKPVTIYQYPRPVMGIVDDFFSRSLHEQTVPTILYNVQPRHSGTFYIRFDPQKTRESISLIEKVYDAYEPFFDMKFELLDAEYQALYEREQVISKISWVVMILAIVIALMGILGLSIFNVTRKLKEIGLRKVFGASGMQLLQLLSREFVILTLIANLVALPFTVWFSREWLSAFAYRIPFPTVAFVGILLGSLLAIFILLSLHTVRVSSLNPAKILRDE